jgi:hypothetical protein
VPERGALGEHEPRREDHDADRAGREADLALDPQRLGAGAGVGNHQRSEHRGNRRGGRDLVVPRRKVGANRCQHDAFLEPVERRIEERAEWRSLTRHPRVASIERVHDRAHDERDPGKKEQPSDQEPRGGEVERKARERDRVGGQARLDQTVAHQLLSGWPRSPSSSSTGALALRASSFHYQAVAWPNAQASGRAFANKRSAASHEAPAVRAPSTTSVR